jgi:hypothetical protein
MEGEKKGFHKVPEQNLRLVSSAGAASVLFNRINAGIVLLIPEKIKKKNTFNTVVLRWYVHNQSPLLFSTPLLSALVRLLKIEAIPRDLSTIYQYIHSKRRENFAFF